MAGGKERALKRRIKSIQSTKKITKAMELIAASRIVKAQQRVQAARPYADSITDVIGNLAAAGAGQDSPLLQTPEQIDTVAFVVVAGDRGLCGGYNSNVIRATERAMQAVEAEGKQARVITVGKKAQGYFKFRGHDIDGAFNGFTDEPSYEDGRGIAQFVTERFEDGTYDQVQLVYTRFFSVASQKVTESQFLPLQADLVDEAAASDGPSADYEFEPSPELILQRLLPRYAEARLFAALLEGAASFFAAQQRAMKSATDNAEDLIVKYSREMNRARQDAITTEIMEIVSGAEALRQGQSSPEDLLPDFLVSQDFLPDQIAQ